MIEFHQVTKRYANGHVALDEVSLNVERGAMAFLTGHSGAGKSTLLRLTTLLERSTRGYVTVGGHNLNELKSSAIPIYRRNIGLVFQDHRLLAERTVFDNVSLPLVVSGVAYPEIKRRVHAALDQVGLLNKERVLPITLSGGEQQRVGIARAVVHKPAVLLADEPTGNLDPDLSREVMGLFERFNQVGVTVLVASHDLDLVRTFGYPVLRLRDGRLAGIENG